MFRIRIERLIIPPSKTEYERAVVPLTACPTVCVFSHVFMLCFAKVRV